jgi:hypothetical protein
VSGHRGGLTVSIITCDSESRLERLLDEVSCFADQIVVGVDAVSTDRTFEIAADLADVVYRFEHPPGQLAGARMLVFRYATGAWILSLDDDESITDSFDELLPALMADPVFTNHWFPRQLIVDRAAFEYVREPPWFPDWQLRLFRNDASLVWKPAVPHSGYRVQGHSHMESRVAIHHFEPVLLNDAERARKIAAYREAGAPEEIERNYLIPADAPRARAVPRKGVAPRRPDRARARIDPDVKDARPARCAPWGSQVLQVEMPARLNAGRDFVAEVTARNTGQQTWGPTKWSKRPPLVHLSFHLFTAEGALVQWDNARCEVAGLVRPSECTTIFFVGRAPALPGRYVFEWDFISEFETWFADNGSEPHRTPVEVV